MVRKALLACGIASSLLYAAMNVVVPRGWEGYSSFSQTISELSALGAPTRSLWVWLGVAYTLLVTAFGFGVWASAGPSRRLRIVGGSLMAYGFMGLFWPPMHLRGSQPSLTDTLHIVFSILTVLLMMLAIGFAAAAFGRRFRSYSMATMLVLVVFGALTAADAPQISANQPTPWIGVWERISIGAFLLWVVVLAGAILRNPRTWLRPDKLRFASAQRTLGPTPAGFRP